MDKTINDRLLSAIRGRGQKATEFRYGIITADRYVKTLQDAIGVDRCYRFMSRGNKSFNDLLKEAGRTLVYSNDEMELEEKEANASRFSGLMVGAPDGVDIPKNALMVFRHTLTSSRKDRDGDILHSDGASVDPKMLLLWQHVHTMPIGPYLFTASQNPNRLKVVSAIVDMNELCHDCAVMVDNGMARFSHGFRALDFRENKEHSKDEGGFEVKRFEIMEESMVSVPSNVDTTVDEVLLSLVEGGKLHSPIMKEIGRNLWEKRKVQVPGVGIKFVERDGSVERELVCSSFDQLKMAVDVGLVGGKNGENKSTVGTGTEAGGQGKEAGVIGTGAPEETDADAKAKADDTGDKEMRCPECGEMVVPEDGQCPECGEDISKSDLEEKVWSDEAREAAAAASRSGGGGRAEEDASSSRTHNVSLPKDPKRATIQQIGEALIDMGYRLGKPAPWEPGKETRYSITDPDGKVSEKPAREIRDMVYASRAKKSFTKAGRVLNKNNLQLVQKAKDHVDDVAGQGYIQRGHGAQLREASSHLDMVLKSTINEGGPGMFTVGFDNVQEAMSCVLTHASQSDRAKMLEALQAMKSVDELNEKGRQYEEFVKAKKPLRDDDEDANAGKEDEEQDEEQEEVEESWPKKFDGDLHKEWHKGMKPLDEKEVGAFMTKSGLKVSEVKGNEAICQGSYKTVAQRLVTKGGMVRKYFTEDEDKRVDAFHTQQKAVGYHIKATSIYGIKNKSCKIHFTKSEDGSSGETVE